MAVLQFSASLPEGCIRANPATHRQCIELHPGISLLLAIQVRDARSWEMKMCELSAEPSAICPELYAHLVLYKAYKSETHKP